MSAHEEKTQLQAHLTSRKTSAFDRYRQTVVGDRGWGFLFLYELVMLVSLSVPGALGAALRTLLFPLIFESVGRGVYFGRNLCIRHPHKIRIGDRVVLDDGCVLDAKGPDGVSFIRIGDHVTVARQTVISCKGGSIEIGSNVNIGICSLLHSEKSIVLEANVLISSLCYLVGGGKHKFDRLDLPVIAQGVEDPQGIILREGCWLGANVVVADGVTVGRGAVVGACSMVNRSLAENSVNYGVPARLVRMRGQSQPVA